MMNKILLPLFISTLALSACAGSTPPVTTTTDTMQPSLTSRTIDKAIEKALKDAETHGNTQEVLSILSQVHSRNPDDPIVATRYARALREDDQINSAARVLEPFLEPDIKNKESITEMAMVQLALGNHNNAEDYAQQAINLDEKNARAYLALGTAQDAQNRHQDAEISFRAGLKYWKGDPSPILNNLALNLASQGHLEEALSLLEKAQKVAPQRMELERNKRIISTLMETTTKTPPAPQQKPDNNNAQTINAETVPTAPKKPVMDEKTKTEAPKTTKPDDTANTPVEEKAPAANTDAKKTKTNIKLKPL